MDPPLGTGGRGGRAYWVAEDVLTVIDGRVSYSSANWRHRRPGHRTAEHGLTSRNPQHGRGRLVEPPIGIEPMTYSLRGFRTSLWPRRQRRKPLQRNESFTAVLVGSRWRMAKIRPSPTAQLRSTAPAQTPVSKTRGGTPQRTLTARLVHATACPTTSSSTPSFHTIHARMRAGSVGVVTSSMATCSKVRERGSFSAALGTSVMTRHYRTRVGRSSRLWCLGGDPSVRSGAVSRLGGDQRRPCLRSDLNSGGWMVTRCDAGAVAGPAGLKSPPCWMVTAGAYARYRARPPRPLPAPWNPAP